MERQPKDKIFENWTHSLPYWFPFSDDHLPMLFRRFLVVLVICVRFTCFDICNVECPRTLFEMSSYYYIKLSVQWEIKTIALKRLETWQNFFFEVHFHDENLCFSSIFGLQVSKIVLKKKYSLQCSCSFGLIFR
jgi:hypothetical protein